MACVTGDRRSATSAACATADDRWRSSMGSNPDWTSHWRVPDPSVLPEEYRTKPWRSQVLVEIGKKP
jgi:hypothetical protein